MNANVLNMIGGKYRVDYDKMKELERTLEAYKLFVESMDINSTFSSYFDYTKLMNILPYLNNHELKEHMKPLYKKDIQLVELARQTTSFYLDSDHISQMKDDISKIVDVYGRDIIKDGLSLNISMTSEQIDDSYEYYCGLLDE